MPPESGSAAREALERRLAGLSPAKRALLLAQAGFAVPVHAEPTVPRAERTGAARLSFGQELLWLLEQSTPGHAYNVPRVVRLRGPLDIDALQAALDALVERHESLRTTFHAMADHPIQRVDPAVHVPLNIVELTAAPEAERESIARERVRELSRAPFDLSRDLQLRASLVRIASDDHVLHLVSHHIASDGWSGGIMLRELAALYDAKRRDVPASLPQLPIQYFDFAQWQRQALSDDRLDRLLTWWRTQLAGAPRQIDLPTDRARGAAPDFEGATRGATLPHTVATSLRALAQREGASGFMVYLAALFVLLNRYTEEEELIVGTPVAGRTLPEVEGVVGFFANTLLLRVSLAGNPSFREVIQRVRAATLGAFDHQEIPLEQLFAARDENNQPIAAAPQVVFMTEDPERTPFSLPGTEAVPFGGSRGATKFDFSLRAMERGDGVRVTAEFRTALFDDASIDRLLQHYGTLLAAAVTTPDAVIADLPLLDADELRRMTLEWNDTGASYPENATIHGLIEAQVDRRPDATAVECTHNGITESSRIAELDDGFEPIALPRAFLVDAGVSGRRARRRRFPRTIDGHGRCHPWHPQGGRRLPADRSGVSG